jgi:hypothetical protein
VVNYQRHGFLDKRTLKGENIMEEIILKAIQFAAIKHKGSTRKGSQAPYIVHPLEVMNILITEGYPQSAIIAGLLHDTLEDTDATKDDIRERFGEEVLRLVTYNSEDKSLSWMNRKTHTINQMTSQWDDLASVVCFADKLSNLRSLFREIEVNGMSIFETMNASRSDVLSYYWNIFQDSWRLMGKAMYHEYEKIIYQIHQAVQEQSSEIDKMIMEEYRERIAFYFNQTPINYKRLFPVVKHLANRYQEHEMECVLATMLFEGMGVQRDIESAIRYFDLAIQHGNMDAPIHLGNIYASGVYVKQDWQYAMNLYHMAKERGCDLADDSIEKLQLCIDFGVDSYTVGSMEGIMNMMKDKKEEE